MYSKISVLFVILTFFCKKSMCKSYTNYTLYRGMPVNEEHLEFFQNLTKYNINFWRAPSTVYRPVDFAIPPENKEQFIIDAKRRDIYLTTIITDLQSAFDRMTVRSYIRRNMDSFNWRSYYKVKDIYRWLKDLSEKYPAQMKLFSIGKTVEGRAIYAVRIIHGESPKRSRVFVEGGIHAREWISPAFVTYMLSEILSAPERNNSDLLEVALKFEWFFVPVLNPDGYEYSHAEDYLWRKNRAPPHGVDINRNFGFGFGQVGISRNANTDIYCGAAAFSEKESQALRDFIGGISQNLEYYIAFHSYGQYMIIPYAQSTTHLENYDQVEKMAIAAAFKLQRRYGTRYSVGTAYDTVGYRTSGVSGCWVKKTHRVPFVMTFELRDSGKHGFALPPELIIPTCQETMDGVISFLNPPTLRFEKLQKANPEDSYDNNCQKNSILDVFVLVSNVFLFIIVRFD